MIVSGFVLIGVLAVGIPLLVQRGTRNEGRISSPGLPRARHNRNRVALWRLILLAVGYGLLVSHLETLTGSATVDGAIGLGIGLFICAHPAANAVNMLFFERDLLRRLSELSIVRWLALNLVVLLVGWAVVYVGLRTLVDDAALKLICT